MSQENVELVRRGYERFNANDVDGFLAVCAPDIEFRDLPEPPGSGLFEGREGFRAWWLGKGSGARFEMEMYNVWTVSDGKVARLDTYADRTDALKVAGLSE